MMNLGKKEKTELTITGIGVIFLIFLIIGNVQKIQAKKQSMAKAGAAVTSSMSVPITFETVEREESAIKQGWGRDPFSRGVSIADDVGLDGLVLNGIMWDDVNPYAIINGDVIKVGDKLGSMKIIDITESSVILEQDNEHHILLLKPF